MNDRERDAVGAYMDTLSPSDVHLLSLAGISVCSYLHGTNTLTAPPEQVPAMLEWWGLEQEERNAGTRLFAAMMQVLKEATAQ